MAVRIYSYFQGINRLSPAIAYYDCDTQAELPSSGAATGSTAFARDVDMMFFRNSSAWIAITGSETVQNQGITLTQRSAINFTGAGVTASDDSVNSRTNVTIPSGSGLTGWTLLTSGFTLVPNGSSATLATVATPVTGHAIAAFASGDTNGIHVFQGATSGAPGASSCVYDMVGNGGNTDIVARAGASGSCTLSWVIYSISP